MKASAVRPGVPDTVHLIELPAPKLFAKLTNGNGGLQPAGD